MEGPVYIKSRAQVNEAAQVNLYCYRQPIACNYKHDRSNYNMYRVLIKKSRENFFI